MNAAEDPAPQAGQEPPVPSAARSAPQRVGWLSAFMVVAVLLFPRGFMLLGFENLTWRDTTPYVLIGSAMVVAAIVLTRAGNRDPRS